MIENGQVLELESLGNTPEAIVDRWLKEISLATKEQEQWTKDSQKILKIYKNENTTLTSYNTEYNTKVKYNILWSTIETTKQAIYARIPKTIVRPRFGQETQVTRLASSLLEKNLDFFISNPEMSFNEAMEKARDDYLLLAKGPSWVMYEPEYAEDEEVIYIEPGEPVPTGLEKETDEEGNEFYKFSPVAFDKIKTMYINWKDFLHSPARCWDEVRWVGKRSWLTKSEIKKLFGNKIANNINYCEEYENDEDDQKNRFWQRAEIWEIWNKEDKNVYYICPSYKEKPIKVVYDPLGLKDFFPCPRPLLGTKDNDSLIPVQDYILTQYLIDSLNETTHRIGLLTKAIKVFGLYDPSCADLNNIFVDDENFFYPAINWSSFAEEGGFKGHLETLPIRDYLQALTELNNQRDRLKQDFYEISGFSDIMRGEATPNESATSQQIRSKFTSLRLSTRQQEMQRFCRDNIGIMAEIISGQFSDETILTIAGYDLNNINPEIGQMLAQALQLLRNNVKRLFSIDVQTDSTLAINGEAEKTDRIELINMSSNFFNMAIGIAERMPEFVNPAMQMLRFGIDAFRASQPIQASLDESIQQYMQRKEQEAQQPPQIPVEIQEMQMKMQVEQQKIQMEMQTKQAELQKDWQDSQMKFQIKQQELQQDAYEMQRKEMLEVQKMQAQFQLQMEKIRGELMLLREKGMIEAQTQQEKAMIEGRIKQDKNQADTQIKGAKILSDAELAQQKMMLDAQLKNQKHQTDFKAKVIGSSQQQPQQTPSQIHINIDKKK